MSRWSWAATSFSLRLRGGTTRTASSGRSPPRDLFIRRVVGPTGASVAAMLAGEGHHYARYTGAAELITCGGGGAFTTTTHLLPDTLTVGEAAEQHGLVATHPGRTRSRRLLWSLFPRLPRHVGYLALLAVLHAALMLNVLKVAEAPSPATVFPVVTALAAVLLPGQTGSLPDLLQRATSFGIPIGASTLRHRLALATHILAQVGLGSAAAWGWLHLPLVTAPGVWPVVWAFAVYAPVVG